MAVVFSQHRRIWFHLGAGCLHDLELHLFHVGRLLIAAYIAWRRTVKVGGQGGLCYKQTLQITDTNHFVYHPLYLLWISYAFRRKLLVCELDVTVQSATKMLHCTLQCL